MEKRDDVELKLGEMFMEEVELPESLQPENIKKRLLEMENISEQNVKRRRTMKNWLTALIASTCAAAAAFALFMSPQRGSTLTGQENVAGIASTESTVKNIKKIKGLKQFASYNAMYSHFAKKIAKREKEYARREGSLVYEGMVQENAKGDVAADGAGHSKTNTRTEGIDEADVVKTDGKYIYALRTQYKEDGTVKSTIRIVEADNGKMLQTSEIKLPRDKDGMSYYYNDIMLEGGILAVFGDRHAYSTVSDNEKIAATVDNSAVISFYDVSDRGNPKHIAEHTQDGYISNTRMKDGIIYTFSSSFSGMYLYRGVNGVIEEDSAKKNPSVDGKAVPVTSVYVPDYSYGDSYVVVTAIDIKSPEKLISSKVIMDSADNIYVSEDNIYFWNTDYIKEETSILKYSYKNGILEPVAGGKVKGSLNNDFSIDEYNGYLRLVTTEENNDSLFNMVIQENDSQESSSNALYILDKDLTVTGKIEDLAKGEYIKSARFMGNMAYFVTFRQTDPLFAADVSDVNNPKILGYLKIPGFSEYMHSFGDGLLFGLGQEADENTGRVQGLKLSMFDISDPTALKEIAKKVFGDGKYSGSYSEAEHNRRAILINPEKNLIGFSYTAYNDEQAIGYVVYGYDKEKGFFEKLRYEFTTDIYDAYGSRGLFIGDYLYIIPSTYERMISYDLVSGVKIEEKEY